MQTKTLSLWLALLALLFSARASAGPIAIVNACLGSTYCSATVKRSTSGGWSARFTFGTR